MNLSTVGQFKNMSVSSMVLVDDQTLRHLQAILLVILDDIVSFCEQKHINYALGGGSVLGAVRHEGFIPWDDDIDINMPRPDYNRFIELFPQEFGTKYTIQAPELTPEVGTSISRVRLRNTTLRMHDDCNLTDCGIFIDIFPIESTYDNPVARTLHGWTSMVAGLLYSCRRFARDRTFYEWFGKGDKAFLRTIRAKALIGTPLCLLPMNTCTRIILAVYSHCKNSNSNFVVVPSGRKHFFGELYRRDELVATRFASFEGREVRIPQKAEEYLQNMYGNWRRIPAPAERERHAYLELDFGPYALEDC